MPSTSASRPTRNQISALREWAARAGHTLVKVYEDKGVSGTRGRDQRPAFDALLKGATRREFDMIAAWSTDRLARSLLHLIDVLQTVRSIGCGLYIHTQAMDTSTPAGRMLFQMLGVIGEFERELIVARVNAGIDRARKEGTKSGEPIGRPKGADWSTEAIQTALRAGASVREAARQTGASVGTVANVRRGVAGA